MSTALAENDDMPSASAGMARRLVLDCETVSNWDGISNRARDGLLHKYEQAELRLPLECRGNPANDPRVMAAVNPWTAMAVCTCLYDPDRKRGRALYLRRGNVVPISRPGWHWEAYETERELWLAFWSVMRRNRDARLVGFNSRGFDGPLAFVRSYILDVECTVNLVPYRYSTREHLDLYDCLAMWGASRCPSLDIVSEICGIESSKGLLDGSKVQAAWDAGDIGSVVSYCCDDTINEGRHADRWDRTVGKVFAERKRW